MVDVSGSEPEKRPKAGFFEIPIICPRSRTVTYGLINRTKAERLANAGPSYRLHELQEIVPYAVREPDSILSYNYEDGSGYCYSKNPGFRCTNTARMHVEQPRDKIFLTFMTSGLVIIEWGWEPRDEHERMLPANRDKREVLWTRD